MAGSSTKMGVSYAGQAGISGASLGQSKRQQASARLGHQRGDDHTRAPIHLTGQDRGWQQDSQREREKERERERAHSPAFRMSPPGRFAPVFAHSTS